MEGHGFVAADPKRSGGKGSLEFVAKDATTAKHFAPLVDAAGKWRTRDDVWISHLDRKPIPALGEWLKFDKSGDNGRCAK